MDYYRLLNELVNKRLGGVHAARIIVNSLDFADVKALTEEEDWDSIAVLMCKAAAAVEAAGADCLMIGANTMHNIAERLTDSINIPLIHIAEAVATQINLQKIQKVALLGTKYTMQMDFYRSKLAAQNIETIIPSPVDMEYINQTIYAEFGKGIFLPETKKSYLEIIDDLSGQGAEGVILGCTEIPILVKQADCSLPVFDSAKIHSMAAVDFALD